MSVRKPENTRTIALVGHEVAGKTSLADALLYKAKAVDRRGCVDEGTSFSDFDDQEKSLKYSLDSSVLHLEHEGKFVWLIDTPGKPDFMGQALAALNAVETAVIVVNAAAGLQVNTRRLFREAGLRHLARMIVVNRIDLDNVHLPELLQTLRESFGKQCVLLDAPNGTGAAFTQMISVITPPASPPRDMPIDLAKERTMLVDAVVESDEALMEKYLTEGDISSEELIAAIPKAVAAGTVIPILCAATKKDKDLGVVEILDAISRYAPSPITGVKRKGVTDKNEEIEINPEDSDFVGQVFKVLADKFVGTLTFFRVFSGTLKPDQTIISQKTGRGSKSSGLQMVQGKTMKAIPLACAGDLVAVAKVEDLHLGDTVGTHSHGTRLPAPSFPAPMFGLAVDPKARGDEQKISTSLHKIVEEDPTFKVTRDPQTKELVITGMSQLHLEVLQKRLKSRFELEIVAHEPKIPYRETALGQGDGVHKHKKQSGGRGQFAEVHLRVYHLPREISTAEQFFKEFATKDRFEKIRIDHTHYDPDHNFGFIDHIVGGTIPNQFIPACEKGCKELLERGALAGYRMQDVAVEVFFGKDHPVDSSEAAFKTAARIAFKNAFLAAKPVLLEPIVHIEITVPSKYTGAILGDLNTKRARIENQDSLPGDQTVIRGIAPLAEMTRYAAQLGSITQGQGSYTMELSHYDAVPGNVQQQIVAKAKVAHDEEE
jgi:elongation factor G